ncbi:MAG: VCBS repeat-containing protein [Proteobacteria bacterium]|nr:VCBS repeat-containing protein [Pseudomonadota bacterium]
MKTSIIKYSCVLTIALMLAALPSAWSSEANPMMGGGPGGGGTGGGGMMGGSSMRQFKIADLDGDGVPEIVTISYGTYLIIMDNEGNVKSSKPLPLIPGQTYQRSGAVGSLDIADLDDDGKPEIVTIYYGTSSTTPNYYGSGAYLVILNNDGTVIKSYKPLPYPY